MADKERENPISAETADALIAAHDGDMALYCLYISRHPGADDETAAAVLCRTRSEIAAAREKLGRIPGAAPREIPAPPAEEEQTQFDAGEIVAVLGKPEFEDIRAELTRILGETPSRAYLNALVDIYARLGMPPEVILVLLHYCDEEARRRWGSSRRPSAKFISDEAYAWARREIMTLELADEYIARCARQRTDRGRIAALLGVRGRELYKKEAEYIDAWLEMGFSDDAIELALERTVLNTGALKWAYLNGILKRWHAADLHDAAAVEKAEGRRRGDAGADPVPETDQKDLERILNKLKGGRA